MLRERVTLQPSEAGEAVRQDAGRSGAAGDHHVPSEGLPAVARPHGGLHHPRHGMPDRRSARRARVRDFDFDNLLLTVVGKGDKQRIVPFSFELRKRLIRFGKFKERQACRASGCSRRVTAGRGTSATRSGATTYCSASWACPIRLSSAAAYLRDGISEARGRRGAPLEDPRALRGQHHHEVSAPGDSGPPGPAPAVVDPESAEMRTDANGAVGARGVIGRPRHRGRHKRIVPPNTAVPLPNQLHRNDCLHDPIPLFRLLRLLRRLGEVAGKCICEPCGLVASCRPLVKANCLWTHIEGPHEFRKLGLSNRFAAFSTQAKAAPPCHPIDCR